jgi:hypothetical protein
MALRTRLNMSAMGSVDTKLVLFIFLPTTLSYSRNLTLAGVLAEGDAGQAEPAHVGAGAAGFGAAVSVPGGTAVTRQQSQAFQIAGGFKLGAFGGVFGDHSVALGVSCQD